MVVLGSPPERAPARADEDDPRIAESAHPLETRPNVDRTDIGVRRLVAEVEDHRGAIEVRERDLVHRLPAGVEVDGRVDVGPAMLSQVPGATEPAHAFEHAGHPHHVLGRRRELGPRVLLEG